MEESKKVKSRADLIAEAIHLEDLELAAAEIEILKLIEISEFFAKRKRLYMYILKVANGMPAENLYRVVKNEIISTWIFDTRIQGKIYYRISDALDSVPINDEQSIIIGIDELKIYMVIESTKSYLYLMNGLYEKIANNIGAKVNLTIRQILRSHEGRKPALMISGSEENIELATKYCIDLFKNPTIVMSNNINNDKMRDVKKQIMLCITVENLEESNKKIDELKRYIVDHNMELFENIVIYQIPESIHNNVKYTISQVRDELTNLKDILMCLQRNPDDYKSVVYNIGHINQTVINGNHNVSDINNSSKTEKRTEEMIMNDAKKWINDLISKNGLNNKSTVEIHKNYKNNYPDDDISIRKFGKLVGSHGYKNVKCGKEHRWIKNGSK